MLRSIKSLVPVLLAFLAGCAGIGGPPGKLANYTWAGSCYHSLREDIEHLAAGPLVDCGFVHDPYDSMAGHIKDCARSVIAGDQPYAFGFLGVGDDSWFCSVAVRGADGQIYDLYYDSDTTGQWGQHGDQSTISISRCKDVELYPELAPTNRFYKLDGCIQAPDMVQKIIAERGRD